MVAAAVVAAAAVGAVATNVAANKASGATQGAAMTAAQEQQWALQQQEALAQPYTQFGQNAMPSYSALIGSSGANAAAVAQLQDLLGLGGSKGNASALNTLESTPGYQFAQQQGDQATINAASASGMQLSGNTLEGLSRFNSGLAQGTYQNALANIEGYIGQQSGITGNAVGMGQAAAAGQAANIGSAATNIGNIAMNQGQNQANIAIGEAGALSNIGSSLADNYATWNTLQALNQTPNWGMSYPTTTPGYLPNTIQQGDLTVNDPGDYYSPVVGESYVH